MPYLLFAEKCGGEDHDLTIQDYAGTFETPEAAMDFYDERIWREDLWKAAAVVFYGQRDGSCWKDGWAVVRRTTEYSTVAPHHEVRPHWADKWDW